ncbi:GntR family transcriptional regulator [Kitasatospora sp. NPDC059646]|uniref:GntR family transcriptional regulator n=1 Tax=Kitasatospora sp. NPDC059646 TaxID=3346893 RepID=UPI00369F14F8
MPEQTWRRLFSATEELIRTGRFPPGTKLPTIAELDPRQSSGRPRSAEAALLTAESENGDGWSKANVERAYRELAAYGLVVQRHRTGTIVRDTSVIPIPLSRYGRVLQPGGRRGPWETATAEVGLDGRMVALDVQEVAAPDSVAAHLELPPGEPVVLRRRHAVVGSEVIQLQSAWYPLDIARTAGLNQPGKIAGGVLGAMRASGLTPVAGDEIVEARLPNKEEASELGIGLRVPVLLVSRITRLASDAAERPIELVQSIAASDRIRLIYKGLLLDG